MFIFLLMHLGISMQKLTRIKPQNELDINPLLNRTLWFQRANNTNNMNSVKLFFSAD